MPAHTFLCPCRRGASTSRGRGRQGGSPVRGRSRGGAGGGYVGRSATWGRGRAGQVMTSPIRLAMIRLYGAKNAVGMTEAGTGAVWSIVLA